MGLELQATTIADRAYARLRDDILFARLQPGARLRLDVLSAEYAASVSTLREILNRLASESLVVAEEQRGFRVAPVSAEGFRDVAAMRLLLEGHALGLAFAAGDLDWEARLVGAHHKLAVLEGRMIAGAASATTAWKQADRAFHQALISACGSETLLDLFGGVFDRYLRYQMVAVVFRGRVAADEHRALLDCALARDAEAALAVLARHVEGCVEHALARGTLR